MLAWQFTKIFTEIMEVDETSKKQQQETDREKYV